MGRILEWRGDPYQIILCCGIFIFLSWVLTKILGLTWKRGFRVGDPHKGHRWFMTEILDKPTYCNFCERPLVRGGYCENCAISVHEECIEDATNIFACKVLVLSKRNHMNHQWVRGNLPLCSTCSVCGFHCGTEPKLCDLRCLWCQDKTHDHCLRSKTSVCDFGKYRTVILPPHCISLTVESWRSKKRFVVREVISPAIKNWSPLLVFANCKSGDNEGERLLMAFKTLLNPVQVVDLHEVPPESALEFCKLLPNHRTRVLICGGDGSVGWVLGALDKVKIKLAPHIAILPLGTGNDLARVLGWGSGYTGEENIDEILTSVMTAKVASLDRWKITIEANRGYFDVRRRKKVFWMNNYFSVGCDAKVVLNFHLHRESQPSLFTSRIINKAVYGLYGARDVLEQDCKDLHELVELEMDGRKIDLPELEGIVILNINSWCGGCELWCSGDGEHFAPPSINDGLLEVAGLYSALHIARLQVNMADPLRLGQARSIKLTLKNTRSLPVQVDGEPWEEGPCVITLTHHNQALMLARQDKDLVA
ncbi:diacylglycerol kinase epsilon-like [Acropora palmata]|uniref:diacylglycerol kinase epsilon-like n=1 Tax=Acropora palmata TaxID=6131 RepID=UPI003DA1243F